MGNNQGKHHENISGTSTSSTIKTLNNPPKLIGTSNILTGEDGKSICKQIRNQLPPEQRYHNEWTLLYSNRKHGASIATFSEIVLHHGPSLLFIQDMEGNIFGAFLSVSLDKKPQFFGDKNCFLFLVEKSTFTETENNNTIVKCFKSTNRNDNYIYFNFGNKYNPYNGLAFGGRMGTFSLCIQEDFRHGKTVGDLLTYDSPQLTPLDNDFEINTLEYYIFPLSESLQIDLRYRQKAKQAKKQQVLGEENSADIFIMQQAGLMSGENAHIRETAYKRTDDKSDEEE
ncbi:hypothetical protein ABK040_001071 [Willaertia magna]